MGCCASQASCSNVIHQSLSQIWLRVWQGRNPSRSAVHLGPHGAHHWPLLPRAHRPLRPCHVPSHRGVRVAGGSRYGQHLSCMVPRLHTLVCFFSFLPLMLGSHSMSVTVQGRVWGGAHEVIQSKAKVRMRGLAPFSFLNSVQPRPPWRDCLLALVGLHLLQRPPGPAAPTRPSLEPFAREWPSCLCWCVAPFRPWLWSCGPFFPYTWSHSISFPKYKIGCWEGEGWESWGRVG